MAPAANTARQRRLPGSARAAAASDSEAEYQAYNGRLKEASAARTRLRKAKQTRDKNRAALSTAYVSSLTHLTTRIQASVTKHKNLCSALNIAHLKKLKHALACRDAAVAGIVKRMTEHRRRMLNLAVQLRALYEGRGEDVRGVMAEGGGSGLGSGGGGGGGGGRDGEGK
ncbi:hypothetical protein C8A05DRAFT_37608 [Staphylotrichum tortipilum]|uniref:Uncharacterized protein n=1 Tax=Staphylotrichum tortipilum TaxID=2831512 RepID=A0AAN6MDC0_9PEZI|nr:hypothetical protein C8A05DRAFT_37608 [Staphylotrichum longicolle]